MNWLVRHRRTLLVIALVTTPLGSVGYTNASFIATSANPNNTISAAPDFVAPTVTLTAPTGTVSTHTPTLTGAAGTASGDLPTVTVKVWTGSTTTGAPTQTLTANGASGTWSVAPASLPDGTYTAQATQTDSGSNLGTSAAVTFIVDTVAPSLTLVNPANNSFTTTATTTLSGAAGSATGDAATVTVKVYTGASVIPANLAQTLTAPVSGGTWTVNASPALADGVYTVQAIQSDSAVPANVTTTTAHTFTKDTVAPALTMTAPSGTVSTHTPSFTGAAGTASGDLPTVTVKVWTGSTTTGAPTQTLTANGASGTWSVAPASLPDGTYTAQASQTDTASNTTTTTAVTFIVDTTAPALTLVNPVNNALINVAATTFSGNAGSATGDATTVTVKVYTGASVIAANLVRTLSAPVSGGAWTVNATPVLAQGVYTVQATQSDSAVPANVTTSAAHTFTLDTTKPVVSAAVIASEDLTNPLAPNFVSGLNSQMRGFRIYANVTDTGGSDPTLGTTSATLTAIIVTGAQTVPLTYHSVAVTVGGVAYNWYSALETAGTGAGFNGTKNWTVTPTDQAGNVGNALAKTVAFDSTLPTPRNLTALTVLTGNAFTITDSAAPTDTGGSGLNNLRIQERTAAGPGAWNTICTLTVAPWSCAFDSTTVPDGSYNFTARAVDNAANVALSGTTRTGTVDNTAPTVTLAALPATISATMNLSATFADGAGTGVKNIVFQRSPHLANTWTTICTANNPVSPRTCSFDPTTATDDTSTDFRATVTDGAVPAFVTSSAIQTALVDYGPRGTDLQANVTNNTVDNGDALTFSFSEPLSLTSVFAGWTTGTQPVQVRVINNSTTDDRVQIFNTAGTTQLPFGTVNLNRNFVGGATTGNGVYLRFTGTLSTDAAHDQLIVTLTSAATLVGGATSASPNATANMTWTPSATVTDVGGHPGLTTLVTETGTLDKDF